MNARANKRRVMRRFHGRFHAVFIWQSAEDRAWDNITPVGREFGSPDYERLSILDMYAWGTITESRAMERLGLDRTALQVLMEQEGLICTSTEDDAAKNASRLMESIAQLKAGNTNEK